MIVFLAKVIIGVGIGCALSMVLGLPPTLQGFSLIVAGAFIGTVMLQLSRRK